ncbi:uncharacterized protein V1510DRAFT_411349 [Dipodascopsis tothii]|uniref:uncharacterized protein n=1 Tax=Dipodascopsis tothii TaxID=44089 RepID=UPI0034CF715A
MAYYTQPEVLKGSAVASSGVTLIATFYYLFGRGISHSHELFFAEHTAFTASAVFIWFFWVSAFFFQVAFLHQLWINNPNAARSGWTLVTYNALHFVWLLLFSHGHYVLSMVVAVLNFVNIASMYHALRSFGLPTLMDYVTIHVATSAMPLAWTFYCVFWNGSIAVHAHSTAARVFANLFVWAFLAAPGLHLLAYGDWALGYAFAWLMWGLGVTQFIERVISLQWIFAFVIATILTVFSTIVASAGAVRSVALPLADGESQPGEQPGQPGPQPDQVQEPYAPGAPSGKESGKQPIASDEASPLAGASS